MSAPEYIEHLMSWVQSNVDNEQMFPSRLGRSSSSSSSCFPLAEVDQVLRRNRRPLPEKLLLPRSPDLQAPVPRVRTHLLSPLPRGGAPRFGATSQHQLQALHLVH